MNDCDVDGVGGGRAGSQWRVKEPGLGPLLWATNDYSVWEYCRIILWKVHVNFYHFNLVADHDCKNWKK